MTGENPRHGRALRSGRSQVGLLPSVIVLLLLAAVTRAQEGEGKVSSEPSSAPSTTAPNLTPPVLLQDAPLELPEGVQLTNDFVDVLLTLDETGAVSDVELVESAGDQADAAVLSAASRLLFSPAMRDGVAVPARIRFRFVAVTDELEPDASDASDASDTPADPAGRPASESAQATQAVRVTPASGSVVAPVSEASSTYGASARVEKPQPGAVSRTRLRGAELTTVPGTFGEPLRVVATLPGVAHTPFGLGFFLVRGASFQNTGFFVDGFAVPLLYHLGAGPAIFSSRLVEELDFYPGGYPVAFGYYTAGIIALHTAPPPAKRFTVELEVDLLRASGLAIVPFGDGRGSVAIALRRSYYELILPLLTDDVELYYADYQLRLDYRFSDKLRTSVFVFGSRDSLQTRQDTGAGATTGSANSGVSRVAPNLTALVALVGHRRTFVDRLQLRQHRRLELVGRHRRVSPGPTLGCDLQQEPRVRAQRRLRRDRVHVRALG
jgi:TonB family protein